MKKIIVASVSYCFPLLAYASEGTSLPSSISTVNPIGLFFEWVWFIALPFLVGAAIVLGIKHFFKKNVGNKKKVPMSNFDMVVKLIMPYSIFAAIFSLNKHLNFYACDCFGNYRWIVVDLLAIVFFIGSIWMAYLIKRNNKEWKVLYTILIILSFVIAYFLIMAVGEYFYKPPEFL